EPVRLTELDAAEDAQAGELRAAALNRVEVTDDVDAVLLGMDLHKVRVVGEGERRQADLECALAAALHRPARSVVRPPAVDVEVRDRHRPRFRMFGAKRAFHRGAFRAFGAKSALSRAQ